MGDELGGHLKCLFLLKGLLKQQDCQIGAQPVTVDELVICSLDSTSCPPKVISMPAI